MKIIEMKSAFKAFYYLMAIDGSVAEEELLRFYEIGKEFDSEQFDTYKEEIVADCRQNIDSAQVDEEVYDIIQEALDRELCNIVEDIEAGIPSRLLLWNLLTLANEDGDYSGDEKRFISHIARSLEIDRSVFLEMEQLILTINSVSKELEILNHSDKPYVEVKPIVEELEKRKMVIVESAKTLIADEVMLAEPVEKKEENAVVKKGKEIGNKIAPIASETGEKAKIAFSKAKSTITDKAVPAVSTGVKEGATKLKGLFGKK